jgi:hypothetical protein
MVQTERLSKDKASPFSMVGQSTIESGLISPGGERRSYYLQNVKKLRKGHRKPLDKHCLTYESLIERIQ